MQLFKRIIIITAIFSAVYADEQRDIILPDLTVKLLDENKYACQGFWKKGRCL